MRISILLCLAFLGACVFHEKATKLPVEVHRPEAVACLTQTLMPSEGMEAAVSIGDSVLEYRSTVTSREKVIAPSPRGLPSLPREGWRMTHRYSSGDVWTHPKYFGGGIGAVLDQHEIVVLYVQVGGAKKGRRWAADRTAFFGTTINVVDHWMLRYGGRQDSDYKFQIVDHPDQKSRDITQQFVVSEMEFLEGFLVKGIQVRGLESGERGLITYVVAGVPSEMKVICESDGK